MKCVCVKKYKRRKQLRKSFRNKSLFSSVFEEQLAANDNCLLFRKDKLRQSEIKGVIFPKT